MAGLTDNHNRVISYLRLSVTDRCNLRCVYCLPEDGVVRLDHQDILTYEELTRLTRLALDLNITKVRLTGGEPLVRRGIVDFAHQLKTLAVPDLRLTTNGQLLAEMAADLYAAGVSKVNVSLDTLQADKYRVITRGGRLERVLAGLDAALEAGFDPVKINVVVMRGLNDDEIESFGRLALDRPFHVRFIEFMPLGRSGWRPGLFASSDEVLARLEGLSPLRPLEAGPGDGPARRLKPAGAAGEIGLISPLSHHFCPKCNRLRLTSDGKLLTCLFAQEEVDLRGPLRSGASDEELLRLITEAVAAKPDRHHLDSGRQPSFSRCMRTIGG